MFNTALRVTDGATSPRRRGSVTAAVIRAQHRRMPGTLISVGDRPGHESPELAALATFPRTSKPGVVSVEVHGDRAEVVITTQPPHPDGCWVYCIRRVDGWHETVSGNGPTVGWDDPELIEW